MSKILVVGDLIHDVIVIPSGEIRENTDTKAQIHKTMGGAAANVAAWLGHLGVDASFIACVAESEAQALTSDLAQSGVKSNFQVSDKPTGSLVVLVQGESRSMLTDRGANSDLVLDKIDPTGFSVMYLSGYALLGKTEREISSLISRAKQSGALVAIDPGSTGFIEDYGISNFRQILLQADLVFPNQEEEELLSISGSVPLALITLGEEGARALTPNLAAIEVSSPRVQMVDPTGAGDAFCAGFLAKLVTSKDMRLTSDDLITECLKAGIAAGSQAVSRVGARP